MSKTNSERFSAISPGSIHHFYTFCFDLFIFDKWVFLVDIYAIPGTPYFTLVWPFSYNYWTYIWFVFVWDEVDGQNHFSFKNLKSLENSSFTHVMHFLSSKNIFMFATNDHRSKTLSTYSYIALISVYTYLAFKFWD